MINSNPFYIYEENKLLSIYRRDEGGGAVDVGYQFGTTGELRVGYEGGWQKFSLQIGDPHELQIVFRGLWCDAGCSTNWIVWTMP